jgi:integrase
MATLALVPTPEEDARLIEEYSVHCLREKMLKANSVSGYVLRLMATSEALKPITLMQANTRQLANALNTFGKNGEPLAPVSRNRYRSILSGFYDWAIAEEIHPGPNPTARMPWAKEAPRYPKPIDPEDFKAVIDAVAQERPVYTWLLLGRYQGLRAIDMAQLRWEYVDWDTLEITILGKGDRRRVNPMHDFIAKELATYRVLFQAPRKGPIFKVPARIISLRIKAAMTRAGVDSSGHCLRHRFATDLYAEAEDLGLVADALGHASINTTRIYAKPNIQAMRRHMANIR